MMTTIIYAHPWHGSYNYAIMQQLIKRLTAEQKAYQLIDLHEDGFNPVFSKEDLKLYSKGETSDELVARYQQFLGQTQDLYIIAPIWWYEFPAILKGFFDKVMLKPFAYTETSLGLKGNLSNIKQTTIISTSTSPKWYLRYVKGNYVKKTFIKGTLKDIGLQKVKWLHFGKIKSSTLNKRQQFLKII